MACRMAHHDLTWVSGEFPEPQIPTGGHLVVSGEHHLHQHLSTQSLITHTAKSGNRKAPLREEGGVTIMDWTKAACTIRIFWEEDPDQLTGICPAVE